MPARHDLLPSAMWSTSCRGGSDALARLEPRPTATAIDLVSFAAVLSRIEPQPPDKRRVYGRLLSSRSFFSFSSARVSVLAGRRTRASHVVGRGLAGPLFLRGAPLIDRITRHMAPISQIVCNLAANMCSHRSTIMIGWKRTVRAKIVLLTPFNHLD